MNQPNALERRWEKRDRSRRLVLMTLGDARASMKKTITQLFSFKTTLRSFLSWKKLKRKRMNYLFSLTSEANTEMECALWGELCKVTAFTKFCPWSLESRLTHEELLFFPPMLIEWADKGYQSDYIKMKHVPWVPASIHPLAHWPPPQQDKFFWPTKPIFSYYFFLSLFIFPHGNIPVAAG